MFPTTTSQNSKCGVNINRKVRLEQKCKQKFQEFFLDAPELWRQPSWFHPCLQSGCPWYSPCVWERNKLIKWTLKGMGGMAMLCSARNCQMLLVTWAGTLPLSSSCQLSEPKCHLFLTTERSKRHRGSVDEWWFIVRPASRGKTHRLRFLWHRSTIFKNCY